MTFHLGIPQIVYLFLVLLGIVMSCINHGKMRTTNAYGMMIGSVIGLAILYWGGFFS